MEQFCGSPIFFFQTYTLSGPRKTLETNFGGCKHKPASSKHLHGTVSSGTTFGVPNNFFQTSVLVVRAKPLKQTLGAATPSQLLPRISMEQLVVEKLLGSQKVFSTTNSSTEILGGGCNRVCCPLEVSHPSVSK